MTPANSNRRDKFTPYRDGDYWVATGYGRGIVAETRETAEKWAIDAKAYHELTVHPWWYRARLAIRRWKPMPRKAWRGFLSSYMPRLEVNRLNTLIQIRLWRGRPHSTYARKLAEWRVQRNKA
jgi:hypothetical protein